MHARYFVFSRRLAPGRLAMLVRVLWGIENPLRWRLDAVFNEDDARSRENDATGNFALLRRVARDILEAHPLDMPIRKKIQYALWINDALFDAFTHTR